MNPWVLRLIILVPAIALTPLLVNGAASLVTSAIHSVGDSIHSLLSPFGMSGDARLEGLIRLCLYLVAITLFARVLFGKIGNKK